MNLKISQLNPGNPALSSDVIPIERADVNFSITAGSIAALAPTTPPGGSSGDIQFNNGAGGFAGSLATLTSGGTLTIPAGQSLTVLGTTSFVAGTIAIAALAADTIGLTDSTGLFTVTGSPATLGGSLTLSAFASQSQNYVLAGPGSGGSGAASFRALVAADIPSLSGTYLPLAGGTMTGNIKMTSGTVVDWNADAGISRIAPATLAIGDGVAGDVSGAAAMSALLLYGSSGYDYYYETSYTAIYSGATQDWNLVLPTGPGSNGQYLQTNGHGVTSWVTISTTETWAALTGDLTETQVIPWDGPTPGTPDTSLSRISAGLIGVGTGAQGSFAGSLKLTTLTAVGGVSSGSVGTAGVLTLVGSTSGSTTFTAPAVAGTATNPILVSNSLQLVSGTVLNWNNDTGISRYGSASLAFGTATAGDATGSLKFTNLVGPSGTLVGVLDGGGAGNIALQGSFYVSYNHGLSNPATHNYFGDYWNCLFLSPNGTTMLVTEGNGTTLATFLAGITGYASAYNTSVDAGISRLGAASLAIGNGTASDTTGNLSFNKVIKYAGVATVSGGIPAEYATVDLTAQTGAISGGTLYTPAASGMFRVSWTADITTADSTASVLGGTNGFQVTYTSPTDSVSKTTVAGNSVTSAANTTGTAVGGCLVVYAKTGVAMTYSYGYTATTGNMAYELHIKVEAL